VSQGSIQHDVAEPAGAAGRGEAPPEVMSAPPRISSAWNDVPLRNKVILLIVLAAVGGAAIGMLEATLGRSGLVLAVGLTLMVGAMLLLSRYWIGGPFEKLADQLARITHDYSLPEIKALPVERRDEVGQIAREIYQIACWSRRDYQEARHLRRTMDHRVEEATRRATRELRQLAMRDALTDVGNRRFLDEHLEPLTESVRHSGEDLICLAIDVDHFKAINDTLGHPAGDAMLSALASLLKACARREDYAIRIGGDEFLVLMPGCRIERARAVAQQLLTLFPQNAPATLPGGKKPGLSIGIASLRRDRARSGRHLVEIADSRLYAAKRAGRGRVA
jgi:diguanylate cyclase (GGDEF)-like protein